jgi:hypothetical protein
MNAPEAHTLSTRTPTRALTIIITPHTWPLPQTALMRVASPQVEEATTAPQVQPEGVGEAKAAR